MSKKPTETASPNTKEIELMQTITQYSEHNNRLLNLSQTISHNLNAYTGNMKILIDFIDWEEDPAERKKAIGHLRTVYDDLNETIVNLSQIVCIENQSGIEKESLNLNLYLRKIKHVINGCKEDSNIIFTNHVSDGAFVNFNPAYLESVLLNFVTNAIKYAHPERFPEVEFNFYMQQGQKILTISDNGLGINLERYGASLFGLYQTFHEHQEATGFGLYITKYQIESMQGKVTVDSKVGEGTTFKIFFND